MKLKGTQHRIISSGKKRKIRMDEGVLPTVPNIKLGFDVLAADRARRLNIKVRK